MIRSKVLVLRTIGGNIDNYNPRQMSHDHIWDVMNNGEFGIADYYHNNDLSKDYDIYNQIVQCNHDREPDWELDDISFIIGIYAAKYYKRFSAPSNYNNIDLFPSILYPYRDDEIDFIRKDQRGGKGVDIAFQFYKKINSVKSLELDSIILDIKRLEFENKVLPGEYPALCFTIELQEFLNSILKNNLTLVLT